MISIQSLSAFGADVETGLKRCMNNETFYLRLVNMELGDKNFDRLRAALDAGDVKEAFEAAHALKGALGNLSLTPIYEPVALLTEKLRGQDAPVDAGELPSQIFSALERLKALV